MSSKAVLVGDTAQNLADALRSAGYGIVRTHLAAAADLSPAENDVWLMAGSEAKALLGKGRRTSEPASQPAPVAVDTNSRGLLELAEKVAKTDVSVLLSGESGAGKEVLARHIHNYSKRSKAPFCAINCAAIPESMLEAELFGYEKGAFTGATSARVGRFEQAQGGTLLLDEITEMPLLLQAKLLRVLQEREVERLGGGKVQKIDVRVIATTNREPRMAVEENRLREDLYYRLNVFPLRALPLRERREDIPLLAAHFVAKHSDGSQAVPITQAAIDNLATYTWPGNVRELENVMQRAIVVCQDEVIDVRDILFENSVIRNGNDGSNDGSNDDCNLTNQETSVPDSGNTEMGDSLRDSMRFAESDVIHNALREHKNNRIATAQALGISERTLRHKLQKLREQGVSIPLAVKS